MAPARVQVTLPLGLLPPPQHDWLSGQGAPVILQPAAGRHTVVSAPSSLPVATLEGAGVATAGSLILTSAGMANSAEVIRAARDLNPSIRVLARADYLRDSTYQEPAQTDQFLYRAMKRPRGAIRSEP